MQTTFAKLYSAFDSIRWQIVIRALFAGVVGGFFAVLYRLILELASQWIPFLTSHPWLYLTIPILGIGLAKLITWQPMATGSGIPQAEGVVLLGLKMRSLPILLVRFIAGAIGALFGLSLGREGPSIQIGACGGQLVAQARHTDPLQTRYLITGGAAAGLSAAFNAPLSGMVFALEEVHRSFSRIILLSAMAASLSADYLSKTFFGLKPVLYFVDIKSLPLENYWWVIPLGIVTGLLGVLINHCLLGAQTLYQRLPVWQRISLALLIAVPITFFLPQLLGSGHELIAQTHHAALGIHLALLYLIGKIFFTSTSFGSGLPGGIFMPILSIGALGGYAFGLLIHVDPSLLATLSVCAMAGTLAASVKAPLTAIILIMELSGSLRHMLPVAAVVFIALLISDLLKMAPIYETLLERYVGDKSEATMPAQIIEVPVEMGSFVSGRLIKEVGWPTQTLILGIRRGDQEVMAHGETKVQAGDYLIILAREGHQANLKQQFDDLCQSVG